MKHLWSPWRMPYIEGSEKEEGCLFCNKLQEEDGPENLIFYRGAKVFALLNRFPYTTGHLMIVPYEHVHSLEMLDDDARAELIHLTSEAVRVLRVGYNAEAFNIGMNIGEAAGAGVADHVHIHVVPRWAGDTSFMSTTANTRVIPEALEETYIRIQAVWKEDISSKDS
ncbi:MAG: HIT domain-containing protein [Anaerolineales bacterium]|nr:HIT domain-containing protein [Anaerolineales bacterium]